MYVILASWKDTRKKEKGRAYTKAIQDWCRISYKMQVPTEPMYVQAAYYHLKLGKGFFRQFSKVIGKDNSGECSGN
jgi:hypothetical protein